MEERAAHLAAGIGALDGALPRATPTERELLEARRAQLAAALRLAREVQSTANGLQQFAARSSSSASGETGLFADISDMERAVPEARAAAVRARQRGGPAGGATRAADADAAATPAPAAAASPAANGRATGTPGLLALGSEWLDLRAARSQHTHFLDATEELAKALDRLSSRLTQQVRDLLRDGPVTRDSGDTAVLAADRATLDAATARFRQLSTLLVPLGEEAITLDNVRSLLADRRGELDSRAAKLGRQFLLRATLLAASVLLILAISSLWRRATFRYLHDLRRRQQFLTLRRVATAIALIGVFVFAVLSEIGSLATYIGFLTAGLAVALQNVILSVVAYFFLIGRHGVRVGDRVTISGQTGRVVDIGLIRIYLAELAGPELTDTGRMIVLSNAVLFQPSALFKQIPGADYTWHTVNLTLASHVDVDEARDRLAACANDVYATYRETIQRRIAAARHLVDFEYEQPEPEIRTRFTEGGLALSVRYPVLPDQAAQIDQRLLLDERALDHVVAGHALRGRDRESRARRAAPRVGEHRPGCRRSSRGRRLGRQRRQADVLGQLVAAIRSVMRPRLRNGSRVTVG
jgi:small-conductance mechanosensitive channel